MLRNMTAWGESPKRAKQALSHGSDQKWLSEDTTYPLTKIYIFFASRDLGV